MILGQYLKAGSSRVYAARLVRHGDWVVISCDAWDEDVSYPLALCHLTPPLGKTAYRMVFDNGDRFETKDHQQVERILMSLDQRGSGILHTLERSWRWVVISVLLMLSLLIWALTSGTHWIASQVAPLIPAEIEMSIGQSTSELFIGEIGLGSLDHHHQLRVELLLNRLPALSDLQVYVLSGERVGANAFALPGSIMMLTDKLVVELNDEELLAVMLHELGHIQERHGLQGVLHAIGNTVLLSVWIGDISSLVDELMISGPVLLQQLSYGRDMERQADDIATDYLHQLGISDGCLGSALVKITQSHEHQDKGEGWAQYFSTHPATSERVAEIGTNCASY